MPSQTPIPQTVRCAMCRRESVLTTGWAVLRTLAGMELRAICPLCRQTLIEVIDTHDDELQRGK